MKTICTEGVSDGQRIERGGGGAMEITQSPPPTVHTNSNVAALRNDRELLTLPHLQSMRSLHCWLPQSRT